MPLERGAALQLAVLLLAVPSQYLISKLFFSQESQRSNELKRIVQGVKGFRNDYLSLSVWKKWCSDIINYIAEPIFEMDDSDLMGESPAVEVFKFRDRNGMFARSTEIRNYKPAAVTLKIGQVVKHRKWGYRGIIVGWDATAKAPPGWFQKMEPDDRNIQDYENQPNFAILVDTRDRRSPQKTYVPQENLVVVSNMRVIHPSIDDYFESFDGTRYIPRPYLKKIYPYG